jgi:hypothetical protein
MGPRLLAQPQASAEEWGEHYFIDHAARRIANRCDNI